MKKKFLYILTTSLFYPAVLGAIIYLLLEDFSIAVVDTKKLIYVIASLGVVISFSIDFIYSYASEIIYSWGLFISDIVILITLFFSYKNLMNGLKTSEEIKLFFLGFIIINIIFLLWDILATTKAIKIRRIVIFDSLGIFLSVIGFFFFYDQPLSGVIFLWLYTIGYTFIGFKDVTKMLKKKFALLDK